jgi:hypothetical protein
VGDDDDVWAGTELPMQEGGGGDGPLLLSPAQVAELEAQRARGKQAEREARARGLFRAQEHAPLALGQVAPGRFAAASVAAQPPPDRNIVPSCRLEEVLLTTDLCGELYACLKAVELGRLLQVSRSTLRAFDKVN